MKYRHEWKHELSEADLLVLRSRLRALMQPDPHAVNGIYTVRSLYFDTLDDRVLREKINGISVREKFRIRLYNSDASVIRLEKKIKRNGLGYKVSAPLTAAQAQAIAENDVDWMTDSEQPLVLELYAKMRGEGLRPKTLVDYTREPFVYRPGNVRVTLDYDIRTGLRCTDLLDPDCVTVPAGDAPILLEVKWDEFLPSIIRDAVSIPDRRVGSFSKYAQCRIYG